MTPCFALALAASAAWAVAADPTDPIANIDFAPSNESLPFMGIGALSGGGGTSRLLFDYPEPQRSDILDALFLPNRGASLQLLKVEIGGDTQSTEATEASHMHTRDDGDLACGACYNRGYEWWLINEAKQRNPAIQLYGLTWGVPGWIGTPDPRPDPAEDANARFFSADNLDYHVRWAAGLKKWHGHQLDYMGIWNERGIPDGLGTDWVVQLRAALDAEPTGAGKGVSIVAADCGWSVCDQLAANATVAAAVDVIGAHYPITASPGDKPPPASCDALGKPLWTSEGWNLGSTNDWAGALNLAATLNKNWNLDRQQAMIVWTVIYAVRHTCMQPPRAHHLLR